MPASQAGRRRFDPGLPLQKSTRSASSAVSPASQPSVMQASSKPHFVLKIVGAVAIAHFLNDLIQAVLPSIYPMLKVKYALTFAEIGWIALVYQLTASLLQPWVGLYMDKHLKPYLLPSGLAVTLMRIACLAFSETYTTLLISSAVI